MTDSDGSTTGAGARAPGGRRPERRRTGASRPGSVRVYEPSPAGGIGRPCLIWLHGGGFIGGDLDMPEADWTAREICARAGAVVVSVDYRLAVDGVHYPVPHDDAVAAIAWVRDCAGELGIDPGRILVGGASAGGNLAAGATSALRDRDDWAPAALVLAVPVAARGAPSPSPRLAARLAELPRVFHRDRARDRPLSENYLGGPLSSADGYAFPADAVLEDLCPTLVHQRRVRPSPRIGRSVHGGTGHGRRRRPASTWSEVCCTDS